MVALYDLGRIPGTSLHVEMLLHTAMAADDIDDWFENTASAGHRHLNRTN